MITAPKIETSSFTPLHGSSSSDRMDSNSDLNDVSCRGNEWTNLYKYLGYEQNRLTMMSSFAPRTTNAVTSGTRLSLMTTIQYLYEKRRQVYFLSCSPPAEGNGDTWFTYRESSFYAVVSSSPCSPRNVLTTQVRHTHTAHRYTLLYRTHQRHDIHESHGCRIQTHNGTHNHRYYCVHTLMPSSTWVISRGALHDSCQRQMFTSSLSSQHPTSIIKQQPQQV